MTITTTMIKELREATGAGPLDCKKALEASAGDLARAAAVLREKGLARAAKKVDRETNAGLVVVKATDGLAAGVEVTCETDFVAFTPDFRNLAQRAAEQVLANPDLADAAALLRADFAGAPGQSTAQVVQGLVGKLGENIVIRRTGRLAADVQSVVTGYVHAGAVAGTYGPDEGRVGVLLQLGAGGAAIEQRQELLELAHELALHIAAGKPRYVRPEDVPAEVLEGERQKLREELEGENKSEAIKAQIIAGRLAKFTQANCLLKQPYLKDDTLTVDQVLGQKSTDLGGPIVVQSFVRFEAGG